MAGALDSRSLDQLDAEEEAAAAHVADQLVACRQAAQPLRQVAADFEGVALQAFLPAITSSTASPIAQETGLPPKVLKYSMPFRRSAAAISGW